MTELRTLKDFDERNSPLFTKENLKQEAIKWVKDPKKINQNWFKVFLEFHNITEEDLNA